MSRSSSPGRRLAALSGAATALATVACVVLAPTALAAPAPIAPPPPPPLGITPGTPCTTAARACVDIVSQHAWLIQGGKVVRGPVAISSGDAGQETPLGDSFHVYRKDKDHKSKEFKLPNGQPAPMPFSVFFADGGVAFHSGSPQRSSAGCVHLNPADAMAFFSNLQVGDLVQVKAGGPDNSAAVGSDSDSDDSDSDDSDSSDDGDSGDDGDSDDDGDSGDDD